MSESLTQEQTDQIAASLAKGRKIEAIKHHREATGQSLQDSKDFVDALVPKLLEQDPEKYAKLAATGKGCASMILLCLGFSGVTYCCLRAVIG